MTRLIEDMLADDEALIRDDGFSRRILQSVRATKMRRQAVLGMSGMAGLGFAAGGLSKLLAREDPLLPAGPELPEAPSLGVMLSSDLVQRLSALPPLELAVLAGAALALATWVWQMVSPQSG
jgi:hypothetical protein